ncbi:MAG: hypothetical protein DCC75_07785 [Proteobacteria bacterium]|nr:MAG: hypothetical protein DCC75_07785 [Pseudomonadota bacterium]
MSNSQVEERSDSRSSCKGHSGNGRESQKEVEGKDNESKDPFKKDQFTLKLVGISDDDREQEHRSRAALARVSAREEHPGKGSLSGSVLYPHGRFPQDKDQLNALEAESSGKTLLQTVERHRREIDQFIRDAMQMVRSSEIRTLLASVQADIAGIAQKVSAQKGENGGQNTPAHDAKPVDRQYALHGDRQFDRSNSTPDHSMNTVHQLRTDSTIERGLTEIHRSQIDEGVKSGLSHISGAMIKLSVAGQNLRGELGVIGNPNIEQQIALLDQMRDELELMATALKDTLPKGNSSSEEHRRTEAQRLAA